MSEENINQNNDSNHKSENIIPIGGMYKEWFLDYASYVILERAVPASHDGLKPVQRRILHSMRDLEDGRYNKVANIIGHTMKYHPHGDASIGDALVQLGQKDLLIDTQGNWGNILTGDRAAAPRYIEARLSKFALEVLFNPKTTNWLLSYDGRNKEPEHLPVKFPLLLAQGAEGIAVGMACKIMPHNFIELIDASIKHLRGKSFELLPDFPSGGMADFTNYNDGLRGGRIKVRSKISKIDNKTILITETPFGSNTSGLIESIIKANDKGKLKVKKIEDNTADIAQILVHLPSGVSPDKTIDALYAFTDCEISIAPNMGVIEGNKPLFIGVSELLKQSTNRTVDYLKQELEIKLGELNEQWHFSSLEKIFIENKLYRDFEGKSYDDALVITLENLQPHIKHLIREVTLEDVKRLLEIKMRRITKHDSDKADTFITSLEEQIKEVKFHLENLIDYAVDYFKNLKTKYGKGKERKTEIKVFDTIDTKKVIVSNKKFYINREDGFIGWSLKKDEYISDCSEIDDIILFFKDGRMMVTQIADKKFIGKGVIYAGVWKKGDKRTIYHMIYQDGKGGPSYMKRFFVNSITRDKEYDLTKGTKGSKLLYFSHNPNGEQEIVTFMLRPRPHLKKVRFDIDFAELLIKGKQATGNRATKELVSKIILKFRGGSTLKPRKIWFDEVVGRLNDEGRGRLLGEFKGENKILTVYKSGYYKLTHFDLTQHFDEELLLIEKWNPNYPLSVVYFNGDKELHYAKRFLLEVSDKKVFFIPEDDNSNLDLVSYIKHPKVNISYNKHLKATKHLPDTEVNLSEFISVKGINALGNQLTKLKVKQIDLLEPSEEDFWPVEQEEETSEKEQNNVSETKLSAEDEDGQQNLFDENN